MKLLLVCSAGMSTSILVNKMQQAAAENDVTAEIHAIAESDLQQHVEGSDVVLIGPQIRYLEKNIRQTVEPFGVKCDVMDQSAFGMMRGDQILEQARQLMK
ncbi:PTS sugar transporter subunit IIB [Gracilibacillus caseinilyticus]|uniref:PTS sugar transporter subunit IIB n=1 Tax=Gracilibacillus caseinilyticus TaxID=2932256 RepID=A0ABY4EX08_9BACI|nr:PTS sugar transporter subunit IIB [Gracilibacillus caseinilyticus]UOQ46706.1 PTS sugar transporter subunit IIB [Gracilibacillus caseinilyticus]